MLDRAREPLLDCEKGTQVQIMTIEKSIPRVP